MFYITSSGCRSKKPYKSGFGRGLGLQVGNFHYDEYKNKQKYKICLN